MIKLLDNIYAECFHPVKVKIHDYLAGCDVVRELPCGKCYHCRITKINEWVTRMVVQSMYSKYVYFGTLTYAVTDSEVFRETSPMLSRFNRDNKLQPTPIVLRKDHLQKFFKRLRKNTGIKFQYFACGEYGTKYGRPHFHYIMWSDVCVPKSEIANSWSTIADNGERVSIGRIEHQDMRTDARNIEHSYKYVCKYVQKGNFNFDKLVTKQLHEKNIRENFIGIPHTENCYFDHKKEYLKRYSPFILCSKRPAIGFGYLQDHIGEFEKGDFRLFGLKGDYVFPVYYYRKTREYICPYKTISTTNGKPNSYSNIPTVVSCLVELQNAIAFNEGFLSNSRLVKCNCRGDGRITFPYRGAGADCRGEITLPAQYFNFYDCKNKYYYYLRGDGDYEVCVKRYHPLYTISAKDLIKELTNSYNALLDAFMRDMYNISQQKKADKMERIIAEYGDYNSYLSERSKVIENLLSIIERKQFNYEQTKIDF